MHHCSFFVFSPPFRLLPLTSPSLSVAGFCLHPRRAAAEREMSSSKASNRAMSYSKASNREMSYSKAINRERERERFQTADRRETSSISRGGQRRRRRDSRRNQPTPRENNDERKIMEENINYTVQVYTVGENVRVCVERSWRTRDTHTEREECMLKRFVLCEVRQDMMGVCLYECMTDSACLYVCVCAYISILRY